MIQYKGMRWFKCDLHMHTPADAHHWQGALKIGKTDNKKRNYAEVYARACYRAGLEVVAITEHNYLARDFLPLLKDAFVSLASEFEYEIVMFPGFELEADVGKGIHVVCLFEPASKLEKIDHFLTECGIAPPRISGGVLAKSIKRLPEILNIVQKPDAGGKLHGLVVVPHVFADSLFDNDRISEWLQQEEYLNLDLLAVGVPKPVSQMNGAFQRLFYAGDNCDQAWKRKRPLAVITSSDCKALTKEENDDNYIGRRYTWIKMSEPSIEALRQAFLDHESRVYVPENPATDINPGDKQKHSRIISVAVSNAEFLQDQEVHFSQNLNCIIGGRGSGKSTILEGMRLVLGKDQDVRIDDKTKDKIERTRALLSKNKQTEVRVVWRNQDGVEDELVYRSEIGAPTVVGREMEDLLTFLKAIPTQFFSQQQLNQMTEKSGNMLLSLIDDFIHDELKQLEEEEREIRAKITRIFQKQDELEVIEKDITRLSQELLEFDRQWKARSLLQEEARQHQGAVAARRYVQNIRQSLEADCERIIETAAEIADSHSPLGSTVERWPDAEWFKTKDDVILAAKEILKREVEATVKKYSDSITAIFNDDDRWLKINIILENADKVFEEACKEKGLTPEDVSRLQEISRDRQSRKLEKEERENEKKRLRKETANLDTLFKTLHECWENIFEARREIAIQVNSSTKDKDKHLIKVSVEYSGDLQAFTTKWSELYTDRRTRLGRSWEDIGNLFHEWFGENKDSSKSCSIWAMLEKWFSNGDAHPEKIDKKLKEMNLSFEEVKEQLYHTNRRQWREARVYRIHDKVDITLFRSDGTKAGCISDGTLSDGQRNTAALALLLARGEGPIVFDQPEDELDSNFIYRDLVPMLRRIKNHRQIILVTHNANLAVNGDAELVYAMETVDGHGQKMADGGLDQDFVAEAVLEIMEGSEEAFNRRREKYHF